MYAASESSRSSTKFSSNVLAAGGTCSGYAEAKVGDVAEEDDAEENVTKVSDYCSLVHSL